jgi:hypothetical protein
MLSERFAENVCRRVARFRDLDRPGAQSIVAHDERGYDRDSKCDIAHDFPQVRPQLSA